jgi:hypothetical protein
MEAEVMNWTWLYMSLETVVFLAFSAAMWLVVKHADTRPGARGATRMTPARATTARDADEPTASQRQAA